MVQESSLLVVIQKKKGMNKVICGLLASFFLYSCATEDRPSYYRYEVRAGAALEPIISGNHENNKYNRLSDQLVSELGDNEASTSGWIASSLNGAFFTILTVMWEWDY